MQMLAGQTIIPLMQGDSVMVGATRQIDRLLQVFMLSAAVQFELVGLAQLLALLIFDVLLDRCLGNMPDRFDIIATSPEGWQSAFERRKRLTKYAGGITLKLLNDVVRRVDWRRLDKKMNVIRHHFQVFNRYPDLISLFKKQRFQALFNIAYQYLASVFWAPDQVITKIIDGFVAGSPSLIIHPDIIHAAGA
jgi:hypothetical protein